MTDQRIMAAFGRLDVAVDPDGVFAERLFTTLVDGIEWGTMPDPSLRGRIRRALGLGALPTGTRALRLAWLVAMLGLLLALAWATVFIASQLRTTPTPAELVRVSQQVYERPPAFSVTYKMPESGDVTLSADGAGTWRVETADEGAGTYWLWDGGDRVARYDASTGVWAVGTTRELNMIGPPGPMWGEYTWGKGEISVDDPVRHAIPCAGATSIPDGKTVLGRPTDHVVCGDIGMQYWLDRETHLILRMEAGANTPHWPAGGSVAPVVEATAFDIGPRPASAFDWSGPASAKASPTPSAVPSPAMPAVTAGVATDQPCMGQLTDPSAIAEVGFAPRELEALLLDAKALGITGAGWSDMPYGAYLHNLEVAAFDPSAKDMCAVLERLGRVIGYSRTYGNEAGDSQVTESVELFLSEEGAAAYIPWFAAATGSSNPGVTTEPVDEGDGGLAIALSTSEGERSWVVFRSGTLVGTVSFQGKKGDAPPVPLARLVPALAARFDAAKPTGRPYDVTHLMSATVPRADLPSAFAPLGWDVAFGGCWDHSELTGQSTDPEAIARDIATYGHEIYCLGMYSPGGDCGLGWCPSEQPAPSPPVGVIRVATGINVLSSPSAAQGWLASAVARLEAAAAETKLEHFDVPGVPGAIGLRRHIQDGDVAQIDTRVVFVRGDIQGVAYVHDKTEADHRADVIAMAKALDARLALVLGAGGSAGAVSSASPATSPQAAASSLPRLLAGSTADRLTSMPFGTQMPAWSGPLMTGGRLESTSLLGRPTVIWFVPNATCASSCTHDDLASFAADAKAIGDKAAVVLVAGGEPTPGWFSAWFSKRGLTTPVVFDWDDKILMSFDALGGAYVFDAGGRLVDERSWPPNLAELQEIADKLGSASVSSPPSPEG